MMPREPRHYVGVGLVASGLAWNYFGAHKRGLGYTICMIGRNVARVDTKPGKAIALGAIAGGVIWFTPHFINGVLE